MYVYKYQEILQKKMLRNFFKGSIEEEKEEDDVFPSITSFLLINISIRLYNRCQNPNFESWFKDWRHLASGWAMNTDNEYLWFFLFNLVI